MMTWPPPFDPIVADPPYRRRFSVSSFPSDPEGYVALPEPDAREVIVVRCVVCGRADERRARSVRFSHRLRVSDDGHAERTEHQPGSPIGGLWWADGALVGSCDVHPDEERITALRLRGPEPFGFLTEPPG